ncbi:MAG: hypothetical protein AB7R00_28980 [Kofleriaceae bacterium]
MRLVPNLSWFAVLGAAACGSDSSTLPSLLRHEFPVVQLEAQQETEEWCQSWTLDNDEPVYVNSIKMVNDGYFHHSNWFWVPEDEYDGPDGTWPCAERDYDQSTAAIIGGVLFAQSTQATDETLGFAPNAAFKIQPHARLIGGLHLVNPSDEPVETSLSFEIKSIREDQAEIALAPATFTYFPLALPPNKKSRFQSTCDLEQAFGAPADFRFYYMLPHYHALGTGTTMTAELPTGATTFFGSEGTIGEPKSQKLDPPFHAASASTLSFSCDYFNSTGVEVGWGNAAGEMCIMVSWTDSPYFIYGAVRGQSTAMGTVDGVEVYEGACEIAFFEN